VICGSARLRLAPPNLTDGMPSAYFTIDQVRISLAVVRHLPFFMTEQSNILQCFKNYDLNCIGDWFIDNIAWALLSFVVIFLCFKFAPKTIQAIKITRTILKENRNSRGNSWGKYMADRFLDIWYSNEKARPLRHTIGQFYEKRFDCLNSRHHMNFIDEELEKMNLIMISDYRSNKVVKPIRNWRNSLIAKLAKTYLIKFMDDNPQYYKDMLEQSKKG